MATRTTLTLDPDVAKEIERRRKEGDRTLKDEVNHLLRLGLASERNAVKPPARPFRTKGLSLGRQIFPIDDVEAAISYAEGEDHR